MISSKINTLLQLLYVLGDGCAAGVWLSDRGMCSRR